MTPDPSTSTEARVEGHWTEDEGTFAKGQTPAAALRALAVKLADEGEPG